MKNEMREQINNFRQFPLKENLDTSFKNKILSSLNNTLKGYNKLPKEIKDLVKFNQIPPDVYQKIKDYYEVEKMLPKNSKKSMNIF